MADSALIHKTVRRGAHAISCIVTLICLISFGYRLGMNEAPWTLWLYIISTTIVIYFFVYAMSKILIGRYLSRKKQPS